MKKMLVTFSVSSGAGNRMETLELMVDQHTRSIGSASSNRNLDGWARQFFPGATEVHYVRMDEMSEEKPNEQEMSDYDTMPTDGNSFLVKLLMLPFRLVWWIVKSIIKIALAPLMK